MVETIKPARLITLTLLTCLAIPVWSVAVFIGLQVLPESTWIPLSNTAPLISLCLCVAAVLLAVIARAPGTRTVAARTIAVLAAAMVGVGTAAGFTTSPGGSVGDVLLVIAGNVMMLLAVALWAAVDVRVRAKQ
ncbi:hypothetical protein [Brevibacterium sp.]|uniref:hypothetical protein n=1 Tax=Brevibacterium sp. TaxID=1701 RepID=UPI0025B8D233|nr:hypothetical protein [Brevibacterium sp.]